MLIHIQTALMLLLEIKCFLILGEVFLKSLSEQKGEGSTLFK